MLSFHLLCCPLSTEFTVILSVSNTQVNEVEVMMRHICDPMYGTYMCVVGHTLNKL